MELGEAFRAIAALEQERLALGDAAERGLQATRLTGEHQRRVVLKLLLDRSQSGGVRIHRHLLDGLGAPAVAAPLLGGIDSHHEPQIGNAGAPFQGRPVRRAGGLGGDVLKPGGRFCQPLGITRGAVGGLREPPPGNSSLKSTHRVDFGRSVSREIRAKISNAGRSEGSRGLGWGAGNGVRAHRVLSR